jgi:hypothetical protein
MPLDFTQEIIQLAKPLRPVEQPQSDDWERVERELGLALPPDYKTLVTALGSGEFGVSLTLKNPVSSSEYARLSVDGLKHYSATIAFLRNQMGFVLFPSQEGLVHIGGADRQHFLFRPDKDGICSSKVVCLDHNLEQIRELNMTLSRFLHSLYFSHVPGGWAEDLRASIWIDGTIPFFTPRPGAQG